MQFFKLILSAFRVGIYTGFREMLSHKFRSFLSILGVLFGVMAMLSMLTLLGGMQVFVNKILSKWVGNVWVEPVDAIPKGLEQEFSRSPGLRLSDNDYLEKLPEISTSYKAIDRRGEVNTVAGRMDARFRGVTRPTLEYDLDNFFISEGQGFTDLDYDRGAQVALINNTMADELRKKLRTSGRDTAILGQYLNYSGVRLQVIGIFRPKDEKMRGWGMRHRVYVPLLTMQKYVSGFDPNPGTLMLKVADHNKLDEQLAAIVAALIARHRGVEDFEYDKAQGIDDAIAMIKNITLLMGIIAAISLLVGGLGIMNVTLASISERIREIGTRKALGASPAQVFIQFIAETTTLSLTGGLLGIPFGCFPLIFADQISRATPLTPTLQLSHIVIIVVTIVSIGVVFGLYPAVKASRMNPIDALRYE